MKAAIIFGTRPEIIKLSPIIRKLNNKNSVLIFTGQHYDYELGLHFIKELGLRTPDFKLKLSKGNSSIQIGEMMIKLSSIFKKNEFDTTIVQGDTNTVLAASLTSLKNNIPISHVESGLRSNDWRMPEEHNRISVDHISDLLFAPTNHNKQNLLNEQVHGNISITGNTVIDAIKYYSKYADKKSSILIDDESILLTLHRAENIENKEILSNIIAGIVKSKENFIFPIHPHTLKNLKKFNLYQKILENKNITILPSVGYFDMIELMKQCSFIVSDSGGLQEEATSLEIRKKVLVLRKTTDRPESVVAGFSELIGTNSNKIVLKIKQTTHSPKINNKKNPYGKGNSSQKILKIIQKSF